jgi:hypothetical protein
MTECVKGASPKSHPIIMSAPMVRALLEGRKTQTRRLVKGNILHFIEFVSGRCDDEPSTSDDLGERIENPANPIFDRGIRFWCAEYPEEGSELFDSPYGLPSDLLWVRESFWHARSYPVTLPSGDAKSGNAWAYRLIHYAADGEPKNTPNRHYPDGLRGGAISAPDPYADWRKRPSIHMPRWASLYRPGLIGHFVKRNHRTAGTLRSVGSL